MTINNLRFGGKTYSSNKFDKNYYTDSGRSSLKLFLYNYKKHRYLIPNFICPDVISAFREKNIKFNYYKIDHNGNINYADLKKKLENVDVIYLINYFGNYEKLPNTIYNLINSKIVIEDNTFILNFNNIRKFKNWFAFNSLRKISSAIDGSLIKTNLNLSKKILSKKKSPCSKYMALSKKNYKLYKKTNQKKYDEYSIKYLVRYESMLKKQKGIYNISVSSKNILSKLIINSHEDENYKKSNFLYFNKNIKKEKLFIDNITSYSFIIIKLKNSKVVKEKLKKFGIYLPIHWSNKFKLKNSLYNNTISIPLISYYKKDYLNEVSSRINSITNEK